MNVLLVYPDYPDTFWSFKYALRFISRKSTEPPLGLLTVAAMLPGDWEKRLVDMKVTSLKDRDLEWADLVMISAMIIQKDSAREVIKRCNAYDVRVVAGGPLFSMLHEEFEGVDHFVLNDAEATLPAFIRDFEKNEAEHLYSTDSFPEMTSTPVPMWDLVDLRKYATVNIQFSRGCPFNCDFCDISVLFGRKVRTKTSDQVVDELDKLYELGYRGGVFFVDDNFIGNRRILKNDLLPRLHRWQEDRGYPFAFGTETSIDLADDEQLLTLMSSAGFNSVFVGIESPDDDALTECNKTQNKNRDMLESVKTIHKYGIMVKGGFILGFDSDKPHVFDNMSRFISDSQIIVAMVGLLNAPKGTKLYKRLEQENRILGFSSGDNTDYSVNFVPKMALEQLVGGYHKVLNSIYSPEHYYRRVKEFLRDFTPVQKKYHLRMNHIGALFLSIFRLGIIGRERWQYWRLFFWSLFKKPSVFALALTCAIYGFHFRKIFEID